MKVTIATIIPGRVILSRPVRILLSDFSRLAALVARLSEREQELLALKYGAGATNRAIAQLTGLTESNVGTVLHRAVETLRAQW